MGVIARPLPDELAAFADYCRSVAGDTMGLRRRTWQERAEWADACATAAQGAVSEIERAHERLTREGVPTHDDHGKPLHLALRIGVALDPPGGQ